MNAYISIIIPTYNEANNIPSLLKRIEKAMANLPYSYQCILIDDNSPDSTYEIAKNLSKQYPLIPYLRKKKHGLSSAMYDGIKLATGRIIGWIDADLQHPPELIPDLVRAIEQDGYQMSIASRLVKGGRVEKWPWYRRFISWGGRMLVWPLTPVKDTMSGFFFLRQRVIEGIVFRPIGYKFGLEIIIKGNHQGKIKEIPYIFAHREKGGSKMTWKTHFAYIYQVFLLYLYKISTFLLSG